MLVATAGKPVQITVNNYFNKLCVGKEIFSFWKISQPPSLSSPTPTNPPLIHTKGCQFGFLFPLSQRGRWVWPYDCGVQKQVPHAQICNLKTRDRTNRTEWWYKHSNEFYFHSILNFGRLVSILLHENTVSKNIWSFFFVCLPEFLG